MNETNFNFMFNILDFTVDKYVKYDNELKRYIKIDLVSQFEDYSSKELINKEYDVGIRLCK